MMCTDQMYTACVFFDLSNYPLHLVALKFFILKFPANACCLHQNAEHIWAINYRTLSVVLLTILKIFVHHFLLTLRFTEEILRNNQQM